MLGPPNPQIWPEGVKLAAAINFKFPKVCMHRFYFDRQCTPTSLASMMEHVSPEGVDFVEQLLLYDPAKRLTAPKVCPGFTIDFLTI